MFHFPFNSLAPGLTMIVCILKLFVFKIWWTASNTPLHLRSFTDVPMNNAGVQTDSVRNNFLPRLHGLTRPCIVCFDPVDEAILLSLIDATGHR
jgi:hypothetical protein